MGICLFRHIFKEKKRLYALKNRDLLNKHRNERKTKTRKVSSYKDITRELQSVLTENNVIYNVDINNIQFVYTENALSSINSKQLNIIKRVWSESCTPIKTP